MLKRLGLAALALIAIGILGFFLLKKNDATTASKTGGGAAENAENTGVSTTTTTSDERARKSSIAGKVVDEQGKPVAGAKVCTQGWTPKLVTADTKEPRCTLTDAQGHYLLGELFAARYEVDASAPQFQPVRYRNAQRESQFTLKAGEARTNVDIVLTHGGVEVKGRVKDISGGVVIGAIVNIVAGIKWEPVAEVFATSDAKGEFTAWLPAGPITASATANGYTGGTKEGVAPGQVIEILLTPESVLQGRVVEAGTDNPIANARVVAGAVKQNPWDETNAESTLTDAEGRFRLAQLQPGRYQPKATAEHRAGTANESVLLGFAETSHEIVIEMHISPSLVGRIEFDDGKPCPSGSLSIKTKGMNSEWHSADADGRVRVEGLQPATYTVDVWCQSAKMADKYPPITLADKDVTQTWKVSAGNTVKGVVVDADGKPVPSATVNAELRGKDPRARMGWSGTTTATDGTFELRGLDSTKYGLTVNREGAVPLADPFEVDATGSPANVRIQLPAGGGLDGKVVDETGAPVSGVEVNAKGDRWEWQRGTTLSRDDGTFSFPALRPGSYHVQAQYRWSAVRAPGTTDDDAQGTVATVTVSDTAHVKLVVESQNGHIDGNVVDDSSNQVSDAFVEAERESDSQGAAAGQARRSMNWSWGNVRSPVLTDNDGHFSIPKLAPGSYTVRAFRKGGGETIAEGVKVGTTTTLTIKTMGTISGTLVDSKGAAPDRFTISVRDEKTGVSRGETFVRTNGVWAVHDLPAGDFVVAGEGSGRAQTTVTLAQGEKKDGIKLTLAPNATLKGQIIALDTNQPVAGMMVFAKPKGDAAFVSFSGADDPDRKYMSDANGQFEVSEAPAGRVTLMIFPKSSDAQDGYGFAMVPATLTAGQVNELPPIKVMKPRARGLTGDFGFVTQDPAAGTDLADVRTTIASVRPNSAAAKAGIVVGDEIVAVDGYDVAGMYHYLAWQLLMVPPGMTVKVGLKRGETVSVTAMQPAPTATPAQK